MFIPNKLPVILKPEASEPPGVVNSLRKLLHGWPSVGVYLSYLYLRSLTEGVFIGEMHAALWLFLSNFSRDNCLQ